ncbi:MAG: Vitamin K epoxide reductase, partial [Parcubacteria group bacterium GW2011_GWC1_38_6]
TSQYNEIGGIPVALFGVIYYLDILTFGFLYLRTRKEQMLKIAAIITPVGLVASIYFVYLQLYVIEAICQYCMLSAGTSTFLFIVGMYVLLETKKSKNNSKNGPLA